MIIDISAKLASRMLDTSVYNFEILDSTRFSSMCARVYVCVTLQWRHNEPDGVSNHQPHGC